jgi:hypothetical protein
MNYFEFKQQLMVDSFTQDEEFHRLRKEDLHCARAYEEAMVFEKTLKLAFHTKVPSNLKDSIILRQATSHTVQRSIKKYAIAATIFISFIVVSSAWYFQKPSTVEQFIIAAIKSESNVSLSEKPIPLEEVKKIFAGYQTAVGDDLGKVRFIHDCHTPGGLGVHMVVATEAGPVTVYYMPKTKLDKDRINFDTNNDKVVLVAMEKGSVAIIAHTSQQLAAVEPMLQNNLFFL